MFFDDRLATVLRLRSDSEASVRTQYRQLLDILGNRKFTARDQRGNAMVASAWLRMDALAQRIPAPTRAAMIRERSWRLRSADLTAHLSDFEPEVASAALNRAELSEDDWEALIPRLPVRARGFLRLRRDLPPRTEALLERLGIYDRALPRPDAIEPLSHDPITLPPVPTDLPGPEDVEAEALDEPVAGYGLDLLAEAVSSRDPTPAPDPAEPARSEIGALVERIEQFRRIREADAEIAPRLPLNDDLPGDERAIAGFGFAADAGGRIEWADPEVAASVNGTRLIAPRVIGASGEDSALEHAFVRRLPINRAEVELVGASRIAGVWVVDARPRFTQDGNFAGYVGRFRRPSVGAGEAFNPAARDADRIRQLLHELRTPVTAIQGYAEAIQQQLFGPAPHEYRAMSASIAADAAHILSGFGELDRLARLEAGMDELAPGESDLAGLTARIVAQLTPVLAPRLAGIEVQQPRDLPLAVRLAADDAEALVWRLLATCGGGCASGEVLACTLGRDRGMARLTCDVPAQLLGEDEIFAAEAKPIAGNINAGVFGAGFALRLARAEARSAGGGLTFDGERVTMLLPLLTRTQLPLSQNATGVVQEEA
jgi:signal transduction histidine kinase